MTVKYYSDSLSHHGTKGMKWGQRLYQNEDGSLTELGKLRRRREQKAVIRAKRKEERKAKKAEIRAQKKASKQLQKERKRSVIRKHDLSKYSNEELKVMTDRLNAEKNYLEARSKVAELNPRILSNGEKFARYMKKTVLKDIVGPAVQDAGKAYLTQFLKDELGVRQDNNNGNKKKK